MSTITAQAILHALHEHVPRISPAEAQARKMFFPLYHGTGDLGRQAIEREGFKVFAAADAEGKAHGYPKEDYGRMGLGPPPIDHLGTGAYLTTVRAIAKAFAGGTTRGMKVYAVDAPRLETINFGAPRTMMRWWMQNGYDPQQAKESDAAWHEQTQRLTDTLKAKWDAVWFKGKGLRRLLDGDQIVVFDPSRIYEVDTKLARGLEPGAKVRRLRIRTRGWEYDADGKYVKVPVQVLDDPTRTKGIILAVRPIGDDYRDLHDGASAYLDVKWAKGRDRNVYDIDVEPVS